MNEGLKHLALYAQKHRIQFKQVSKIRVMPLFSFLDQLISLMKKYISTSPTISWGQFIAITCSHKLFSTIYGSWLSYNKTSLQSKLISTLLTCASVPKISTFLKLRKLVLKTRPQSNKCLDGIQLQHQQIIGILHNAYNSLQSRKKISQGIKSLFISYRMQQARICSCVFIQYALSLHDDIYFKQNNQATIAHQHQQYGTIPQSILGYSSIISQNPNNSSNNNKTNNSQYISNFQSIIHGDNGLYRKVKSSHVSLQGFKVIDHKFKNSPQRQQNNQNKNQSYSRNSNKIGSKMGQILQQQGNNQQEINTKNRNSFQIYQNSHSSHKKNMKTQGNIYQSTNNRPTSSITPNKFRDIHQNSIMRNSSKKSNSKVYQGQHKDLDNRNSLNYSATHTFRSPTYTQKFKSPDMDYSLTPNTNNKQLQNQSIKQSKIRGRQLYHQYEPQNQLNLKLVKIPQPQQKQRQQPYRKQGGYQMWKKLNERNRSFMQRMLRADLQKKQILNRQLSRLQGYEEDKDKDKNKNKGDYQSINVIHDSIVRHSGVDRWNPNQNKNQKATKI